jgi:CHAT domain-containing protein
MENGKVQLYQLPRKAVIQARILEFEKSVRENNTQRITTVGRRLYRDLFGRATNSLSKSTQWFISLDNAMYTLELPALVVGTNSKGPLYLTQRKTLLVTPGAKLFSAPERAGFNGGRFVVAGDGIYNRADPRYGKFGLIQPAAWSMARLPGSAGEIQFAAGLWRNASLLTGSRMTRSRLLSEVDRDPDVIHIASHVIEGPDRWHAGILALGIDPTGEPELLTSREIELHPIHSRLVVMTGCESGSGEALPGSGLMGLTRAWLAAGAGEVLATRRASVDENGDGLIGRFYRHLLESPAGDIPQALRQARRDMIAAGGWRAEPRYWSSFFLIGVR